MPVTSEKMLLYLLYQSYLVGWPRVTNKEQSGQDKEDENWLELHDDFQVGCLLHESPCVRPSVDHNCLRFHTMLPV